MRKTSLLLVALSCLLLAGGVSARSLDAGVVTDLLNAGVSEDAVRRYVERNQFSFQLTAEALKALKAAGASDDLIAFLQDHEAPAAGKTTRSDRPEGYDESATGEGGEYSEDYDSGYGGDYGVASPYSYGYYGYPAYSYGFYYGYPYYYPGYLSAYYYPSYFHYGYYSYPRTHLRHHSGRLSGRGTGVYSFRRDGSSGRTGVRSGARGPSSSRSRPAGPSRGRSDGRGRR